MRQRYYILCVVILVLSACRETTTKKSSPPFPRVLETIKFVDLLDPIHNPSQKTFVTISFDSLGLHFYAELEEDDIKYSKHVRDSEVWKDPCIEFFFDPGNDGLDYYEMQFNALPQTWDLKLKDNFGPINAPDNMIAWDIGNNFKTKIIGSANDASDVDDKWVLTGTMPWNAFSEGMPKKGDIWGYNLMRVDYDAVYNPTYWVAYPTGGKMIHHPETWPTILF